MIGSLLSLLEAFFEEVSSSLGKKSIAKKEESPYAFLFITYFVGALVYVAASIGAKLPFIFSVESIPTFTVKIILEMLLSYVAVKSLTSFDRSFFSLSRMMTIPFVLIIDAVLGTTLPFYQIVLLFLMLVVFAVLCVHNKVSFKKLYLALPLAVLPAFTIILLKYNISHFNSVFAEQVVSLSLLALWALVTDIILTKENPLRLLTHPIILAQATCSGVASIAGSYAYNYGSATIITALRRAFSLLTSLLSDVFFFKKKTKRATVVAIIALFILLFLLTYSFV